MKNFLLRLKFWQRGLIFGLVTFVCIFTGDVFWLVKGYTGKCGDLLSQSAKTYVCSLQEYILNDPFYGLYSGVNARLTWLVYLGVVVGTVLFFSIFGFFFKRGG